MVFVTQGVVVKHSSWETPAAGEALLDTQCHLQKLPPTSGRAKSFTCQKKKQIIFILRAMDLVLHHIITAKIIIEFTVNIKHFES